jgi:hypothetical protein
MFALRKLFGRQVCCFEESHRSPCPRAEVPHPDCNFCTYATILFISSASKDRMEVFVCLARRLVKCTEYASLTDVKFVRVSLGG